MTDDGIRACRLLPYGGPYYCGAPDAEFATCRRQGYAQPFAYQCPYVLERAVMPPKWARSRASLTRPGGLRRGAGGSG